MPRKFKTALLVLGCVLATLGAAGVLRAVTTLADTPFDVPGVVPSASPIKGSAHSVTNEDIVYRLPMHSGQWFYARMTGAKGTDFDLHVFGPQTTSVASTQAAVASSEGGGTSTERILYRVAQTGDHFLNVWAYSGVGTFTVEYGFPSIQPSIALTTPSSIPWGGTAAIVGTVTAGGRGVSGKLVELRRRPYGKTTVSTIASAISQPNGAFRFSVKPTAQAGYYMRFTGDTTHLPVYSAVMTVSPAPYLSRPSAPSSVRKGVAFTSAGWLRPMYPKGSKTVRISCYRMDAAGVWVYSHKVLATNSDRSPYSRYTASLRLPSAGKWKLVASVPETSAHLARRSWDTTLTAKP